MRPVRLALVGFGNWGRNYVNAARDSGEAEVSVVVCSPENAPNSIDWSESVLDVVHKVDAVVYAGHPRGAAQKAAIALHADKPILIEKPAGLSVAAARGIDHAEKASNGFVLIGNQHLFAPELERMRRDVSTDMVTATFTGPTTRDYPARWDYGAHAVACVLALSPRSYLIEAGAFGPRAARVEATYCGYSDPWVYDGYETREPPLTTQVRAFARAVRDQKNIDWRFGARWAVNVAEILERADRLDAGTLP